MRREIFGWWSERLGMHMPIIRYGEWGPALLWFPTWQADAFEAENQRLVHAIHHHIEAGRLTLFCVNSVNASAWYNESLSMGDRAWRHELFSRYVEEEVVPYVRGALQNGEARLCAGGASFGALFATNALFRRPDLFFGLIGMSGVYRLDRVTHGYSDQNAYLNSPSWYVPNLPEDGRLERLRRDTHIELLTGRGQWEYPHETEEFAGILRSKGIPHRFDDWGYETPHDWPSWHRMLEVVIRERMGW